MYVSSFRRKQSENYRDAGHRPTDTLRETQNRDMGEKGEGFNILPLKVKGTITSPRRSVLRLGWAPSHKAGNIS